MSKRYTKLDAAVLLTGFGVAIVLTYAQIRAIRNSVGESYLSLYPLGGYEAVLILALLFLATVLKVYLDWSNSG